jgi:pimeloyl-ACP methyl ester carboxylesterase
MMTTLKERFSRSIYVSTLIGPQLRQRLVAADTAFTAKARAAYEENVAELFFQPPAARALALDALQYPIDLAQRWVLFWDTIRQRGNTFIAHHRAGLPPVLQFEYEVLLDARKFERPVNYALLRIVPPPGNTVDARRRPYVIIDPRGGHGPGVGGFKRDSEVGVALRAGHPVYFVTFFPRPEPGQTLIDVCTAEATFVAKVRELHPDAPKPTIIGNCQGGWAAMLLAASHPDETGPVVIHGAPMSYWGGAWREGEGDNPMRYAGGLLGGTWGASFASDAGNGIFDGAHLVGNFENLNPANTFWDKYYSLFKGVDDEAPRFLEFERWWGGFYLLGREEMDWITQNLFVGNKLRSGGVEGGGGKRFDLRDVKVPIVMFASLGDNITPPQQAFNWVADVYRSTEEIKARGQVIVGLLHESAGHLGIFVSGQVARKEHAQIVSVLKSIEALPPGLYAMKIAEGRHANGEPSYEVSFVEQRLEDVVPRLNRYRRLDEKPFEAVAAVAEVNQRLYDLVARPVIQALANEPVAKLARVLHPMRVQRWFFSDVNPGMWWLRPAAAIVRRTRWKLGPDAPSRRVERMLSGLLSASLDSVRAVRDATCEALFFHAYGYLAAMGLSTRGGTDEAVTPAAGDPRQLPVVKEALAAIDRGGRAEAIARVCALLSEDDVQIPLALVEFQAELMKDYASLLPSLPPETWRRIRGEQDLVVRYARKRAIETLPALLAAPGEREQFLALVAKLEADPRLLSRALSPHDRAVVEEVHRVLSTSAAGQDVAAPQLAKAS